MCEENKILFDSLYEGEEEDLSTTISGDRKVFLECKECHQEDGLHDKNCGSQYNFWDSDVIPLGT